MVGVLTAHNGTSGGYLQVGRGTHRLPCHGRKQRPERPADGGAGWSNSREHREPAASREQRRVRGRNHAETSSSNGHLFSQVMAVHNHQHNITHPAPESRSPLCRRPMGQRTSGQLRRAHNGLITRPDRRVVHRGWNRRVGQLPGQASTATLRLPIDLSERLRGQGDQQRQHQ